MSVALLPNDTGKTDAFIDDIIMVAVDLENNVEQIMATPCTNLYADAHKTSGLAFAKKKISFQMINMKLKVTLKRQRFAWVCFQGWGRLFVVCSTLCTISEQ